MNVLKFYSTMFCLAVIVILSIPIASLSFFWAVQKNAWRFGRDFLRYLLAKEDTFP